MDTDDPGSRHTGPDAAVRDHLANERTLLAWQRTALGLIGLGLLVDRFALDGSHGKALGTVVGLALMAAGAMASAGGVLRFVRVERQIDTDSYQPALLAHLLLAGAIVVGTAALALWLVLG